MSDIASEAQEIATEIYGCPVIVSLGQQVLLVSRDKYVAVMKALLDDTFDLCVDLTAVDYLLMPRRVVGAGIKPERFEVVVSVMSMQKHERLRLRVQVPADDATLETLFDVHPGTEALEREVFDMF